MSLDSDLIDVPNANVTCSSSKPELLHCSAEMTVTVNHYIMIMKSCDKNQPSLITTPALCDHRDGQRCQRAATQPLDPVQEAAEHTHCILYMYLIQCG